MAGHVVVLGDSGDSVVVLEAAKPSKDGYEKIWYQAPLMFRALNVLKEIKQLYTLEYQKLGN